MNEHEYGYGASVQQGEQSDDLLIALSLISEEMAEQKNSRTKYKSDFELVLEFGTQMLGGKRPEGIELKKPKQCFYNALDLATTDSKYIYCEGFILCPGVAGLPIYHGWCFDTSTSKAVENTLREDPETLAYYGIPFNHNWLMDLYGDRYECTDYAAIAVLGNNYMDEFNLAQGFPDGAIWQPKDKAIALPNKHN